MSRLTRSDELEEEMRRLVPSVEKLGQMLASVDYLAEEGLATSTFLALRLPQPLLLEGEAGVGKTELAKALAEVLDTPLIRLQCYEGIDASEALYEWNYPKQLLSIRVADSKGTDLEEEELFGPDYLIRRPLLRALEHPGPRPAVLLIDELDRADDDFEAFLLELLAEATVTIPEIGTIKATHPPIVILTSNRTRDLHDAVKRRCLYQWIDYPGPKREVEIVRRRVKTRLAGAHRPGRQRRVADAQVRRPEAARHRRGDRLGVRAGPARRRDAHRRDRRPDARLGPEVLRGPGGHPRSGPRGPHRARGDARLTDNGNSVMEDDGVFRVEELHLDLPAVVGAFSQRLHDAGMPVTPSQTQQYARSLVLTKPVSRRRLYWTTRAIFVTGFIQLPTFDRVFREVFGTAAKSDSEEDPEVELEPAPPKDESENDEAEDDDEDLPDSGEGGADMSARRGERRRRRGRRRAGDPDPLGERGGGAVGEALLRARRARARRAVPAHGPARPRHAACAARAAASAVATASTWTCAARCATA